jgi:hypothetical protein
MGSLFRRLFDLDDDKIAAGALRNNVGAGKMSFLPAIRLLGKLAVRIVDVNGYFCLFDLASHPKPIVVPLKKLLSDRLLFTGA